MSSESSSNTTPLLPAKPPSISFRELRILAIVATVSLAQGLISGLGTVWSYLYKDDYQLQPSAASSLDASLQIPWMIKPLWGILSDNLPIFGYKRKSYLILSSIICAACLLYFGLGSPPLAAGISLLLLINIAQSVQAIVGQAILVENAQEISSRDNVTEDEKSKAASRGISMFYGMKIIGGMVNSLLIATLLTEQGRHRFLFYFSFIPVSIMLFSSFLPEKKVKAAKKTPQASVLALNSSVPEPITKLEVSKTENLKRVYVFIKNPMIFKAMIIMFLNNFLPGSGQASFYYYTNELGFKPDFLGTLNIIANVATIFGVLIYNKFFATVNLKKFYTFTQILCAILTASMIILYNRWNVSLEVSDQVFMVIDNFVTSVVGEVNSLPLLILACRLCPKNIEASVFSILSATSNTAGMLSSQLSALLIGWLGITSTNFDNLGVMALLRAGFQIFPLFVLWSVNLDEAIKDVNKDDKKDKNEEKEERNDA